MKERKKGKREEGLHARIKFCENAFNLRETVDCVIALLLIALYSLLMLLQLSHLRAR